MNLGDVLPRTNVRELIANGYILQEHQTTTCCQHQERQHEGHNVQTRTVTITTQGTEKSVRSE